MRLISNPARIVWLAAAALLGRAAEPLDSPPPVARNFEIQVVDDQTRRGIPWVELETVHRVRYVTDSTGRVAFAEPGLMEQPMFFFVRSHG
jgi:hypothetical protein